MKKEPFGKLIVHLSKDIQQLISKELFEYKLGKNQFKIVMYVNEKRGLCQEQLSKMIGVDKTTTAKAVKKIIELGYIQKTKNSVDRRFYKLYPTKDGEKLYPKIKSVLMKYENIIEEILNVEEKDSFRSAIFKIKTEINKRLTEIND